jgi:DNA-binding MarR family transcriptional regulator
MPCVRRMVSCMLGWRRVAAADVSTTRATAQVEPPSATCEALDTSRTAGWRRWVNVHLIDASIIGPRMSLCQSGWGHGGRRHDVLAGGRAVRRRMTSRELAIWRSLLGTTAELRTVLGAALQESSLSPGDYQVLLALSEAEGRRLRSSELARTIDWGRSRLSHHIKRMERRRLVRREDCATDNRGAEVILTVEGARVFRRATAPHMRAIKKHFADVLTAEQFESLAGILQALQNHLHRSNA